MEDNFNVVMSEATFHKLRKYKEDLDMKRLQPGENFKTQLMKMMSSGITCNEVTIDSFFQALMSSKKPRFLTKRQLKCDGSDWNEREIDILGDVAITLPNVDIYDNGVWSEREKYFQFHEQVLKGSLLYIPGTLLDKGRCVKNPPDYEVIENNTINQDKFNQLIERRFHPALILSNNSKKCVVTVPGLGCGVFAGKFKGKVGNCLNKALQYVLEKHHMQYSNIVCVYFDPYKEGTNETKQFGHIKYMMRPARLNPGRPLLSHPTTFQEDNDFSDCIVSKVVAWDHVSWPGNNFYSGSRSTDDGVSAAATDSMFRLTGVEGSYLSGKYMPPTPFRTWLELLNKKNIQIKARDNVWVVNNTGVKVKLCEFNKEEECQ